VIWGFPVALALLAVYLAVVVLVNRHRPPGDRIKEVNAPANLDKKLGGTIKITIWNVGYAGLGKGSDFVMDGGKSWAGFPPRAGRLAKIWRQFAPD